MTHNEFSKTYRNIAIRIGVLIFLVVPLAAWFLVKPVRVVDPGVLGIDCQSNNVCVDNPQKINQADQLRNAALNFVDKKVYQFTGEPRLIFCSTQKCANTFGLGKRSALTFASYGSVFSPRAWKPYYVRHELIHQAQEKQLGVVNCLMLPSWIIEGMAYALSDDPRNPLHAPWQAYRARFERWHKEHRGANMWQLIIQEW